MVSIALIGLGRWGMNYLRTLNALPVDLRWICARTQRTLDQIDPVLLKKKPQRTTSYREILQDTVDAVCIVTPAATHYDLTKQALLAGKHVLVEKPFTTSLQKAEELVQIAQERKLILMVGHIHRFNPAVEQLLKICKGVQRIESVQQYPDLGRIDAGALWDMLPHPLSIAIELLPDTMPTVRASVNRERVEAELQYPRCTARFRGTWGREKRMEFTVQGEQTVVFEPYAKDQLLCDGKPQSIIDGQPLQRELEHFIDCIRNNQEPITSGRRSLAVMRLLDSIQCAAVPKP